MDTEANNENWNHFFVTEIDDEYWEHLLNYVDANYESLVALQDLGLFEQSLENYSFVNDRLEDA